MATHIHIHRGRTADNWEESKHPRSDDGKFGKGSGGAKAAPAAAPKQGGSAPIDTSKPAGQRLASGLLRQATGAPAPSPAIPDDIKARLAKLSPKIQAQQNEGKANERRAFSNLGPDMPGFKIPPKPGAAPAVSPVKPGSSALVSPGAPLAGLKGAPTQAENVAAGLAKADEQGSHLRKLKLSAPVSTPEGPGHWAGMDRNGRAMVNIGGRVHAFHPTKVTEGSGRTTQVNTASQAGRNLLSSFLASENAKTRK